MGEITSSMALTRSIFLALGLLALAFGESVHEVEFTVNLGGGRQANFVIEVHPEWAPNGAARFMELVETDFFKGNRFFRVMESRVSHPNGLPKQFWMILVIKWPTTKACSHSALKLTKMDLNTDL